MVRELPEFSSIGRIELRSSEDARTKLSNLYGVLVLSALMFDGRDADSILKLAANAVSSLGAFHTDATYRIADGTLVDSREPDRKLDRRIDSLVTATLGTDVPIELPDGKWRHSIALKSVVATHAAITSRKSGFSSLTTTRISRPSGKFICPDPSCTIRQRSSTTSHPRRSGPATARR